MSSVVVPHVLMTSLSGYTKSDDSLSTYESNVSDDSEFKMVQRASERISSQAARGISRSPRAEPCPGAKSISTTLLWAGAGGVGTREGGRESGVLRPAIYECTPRALQCVADALLDTLKARARRRSSR